MKTCSRRRPMSPTCCSASSAESSRDCKRMPTDSTRRAAAAQRRVPLSIRYLTCSRGAGARSTDRTARSVTASPVCVPLHRDELRTDVQAVGLLHLFHRVPCDDVADLVAEHPGELAEVFGLVDETTVHVDEAAGHREGVDLGCVDDEKVVVDAAGVSQPGDGIAE